MEAEEAKIMLTSAGHEINGATVCLENEKLKKYPLLYLLVENKSTKEIMFIKKKRKEIHLIKKKSDSAFF